MDNEIGFVWNINFELNDIYIDMWIDFWNKFFFEIMKEHSFVSEGGYPEIDRRIEQCVLNYLTDVVYDLAHIYGFNVKVDSGKDGAHLYLDFCSGLEFDDLNIDIKGETIFISKFICDSLCYKLVFNNFRMVGYILKDFCYKLFNKQIAQGKKLEDKYNELVKQTSSLTSETVNIAKNSIRSLLRLYKKNNIINIDLRQNDLYSYLFCDDRVIRVFHKEFMDNPGILINELNSLSSITK